MYFLQRTHDGYYSDTYAKYPVHKSTNQADEAKMREKYKTAEMPRPPDRSSSKNDPYKYTRYATNSNEITGLDALLILGWGWGGGF